MSDQPRTNPDPVLTIDQQFAVVKYQQHIKAIPREELEDLFVQLLTQKLGQENLFNKLMRTR